MVRTYIPHRGDIVWLEFNPQKGKEINKTRPALVISPEHYNKKTGLALFMPITSKIKQYPFESIVDHPMIKGAVLCDQIRSLDWNAHKVKFLTKIPEYQVLDILEKFKVLIS